MKAIHSAIQRLDPPTQAELARRLNVKPQQVNLWTKRGWAAPRYAPAIADMTGIACRDLVADMDNNDKG